ncbi:MAG: YkgJ family cysteine cluster protein [Povalibacter sp.]
MRASLLGDIGTDVPCGTCVGCCVSSYHIPIRPADARARSAIPAEYLVAAPGQPSGHLMMGYLEDGTCPMLKAGKCSVYEHRPQTCRDYDCRIFAAAGIDAGGPEKHVINKRIHEWSFSYPSDTDQRAHEAVLAAAAFIRENKSSFPGGRAPTAPTGIAVLAIKVYKLFLDPHVRSRPATETALAIIQASGEFDSSPVASSTQPI